MYHVSCVCLYIFMKQFDRKKVEKKMGSINKNKKDSAIHITLSHYTRPGSSSQPLDQIATEEFVFRIPRESKNH